MGGGDDQDQEGGRARAEEDIGSFLMPDDALLDPIYAHLARREKPLPAHLAEPIEAWLPLDPKGVHFSGRRGGH